MKRQFTDNLRPQQSWGYEDGSWKGLLLPLLVISDLDPLGRLRPAPVVDYPDNDAADL